MPSPGYIVSCSEDTYLRIWDYTVINKEGDQGRILKEFSHGDAIPRCLAYSGYDDHLSLLVGTDDYKILKFQISSGLGFDAAIQCYKSTIE